MDPMERALNIVEFSDGPQRIAFLHALLGVIDPEDLAQLLDTLPWRLVSTFKRGDGVLIEYAETPMCDGGIPPEWVTQLPNDDDRPLTSS